LLGAAPDGAPPGARRAAPRAPRSALGDSLGPGAAQVIPVGEGGVLAEAFNIRLEELNVVDLKFLPGCARPTLALLWQDPKQARHVRTYVVDAKQKARARAPAPAPAPGPPSPARPSSDRARPAPSRRVPRAARQARTPSAQPGLQEACLAYPTLP